ncbi:MAG: proline dehydrogenase family protein [Chloroflexota bacterium]|nr:proline dehydrogenase family protein [Chloroflexota bacterium]
MSAPRVELLATPDCPHAAPTEALLRSILEESDERASVERTWISDLDHAAGMGFYGSPTVRIDGQDVAPLEGAPIGLGCRLYRRPDGSATGVPSEGAIRAALAAWQEQQDAEAARPGPLQTLQELPERAMRAGFVWASQRDSLERLSQRLPLTRSLVRRFVAGQDLPTTLVALRRLRSAGLATTVDVLGESVASEAAATAAADRYLEVLDALAEHELDGNVSVKLTQMGLDVDEAFCRRNVARIVERAAAAGAFVRIDMEDHTRTDATLRIVRHLHAMHGNVGAVIQSYLRRSADDVERLISEGMRVRLCKGAYNEPSSVAFETKAETDESYIRLMERLLVAGEYPGLATHDERIISHARDFVAREDIGNERFEFQMLYGVRRDLQEALAAAGHTVRVYVPFGAEWYPYFMRRLAERPANVLFVLKTLMRDRG